MIAKIEQKTYKFRLPVDKFRKKFDTIQLIL